MEKEAAVLHDELRLVCPDGFHIMDKEELSLLRFVSEGQGACLSDPQRHMVVSAAWKEIGVLSALLLGGGDLKRNMESHIRKSMRPFGYRFGGAVTRAAGGRALEGFCYTYTAQETAMYAESCVIRIGKTLFYFHLYARDAMRADSIAVWEALLADAQWTSAAK